MNLQDKQLYIIGSFKSFCLEHTLSSFGETIQHKAHCKSLLPVNIGYSLPSGE